MSKEEKSIKSLLEKSGIGLLALAMVSILALYVRNYTSLRTLLRAESWAVICYILGGFVLIWVALGMWRRHEGYHRGDASTKWTALLMATALLIIGSVLVYRMSIQLPFDYIYRNRVARQFGGMDNIRPVDGSSGDYYDVLLRARDQTDKKGVNDDMVVSVEFVKKSDVEVLVIDSAEIRVDKVAAMPNLRRDAEKAFAGITDVQIIHFYYELSDAKVTYPCTLSPTFWHINAESRKPWHSSHKLEIKDNSPFLIEYHLVSQESGIYTVSELLLTYHDNNNLHQRQVPVVTMLGNPLRLGFYTPDDIVLEVVEKMVQVVEGGKIVSKRVPETKQRKRGDAPFSSDPFLMPNPMLP